MPGMSVGSVTAAELDVDPYGVYRRLRDGAPIAWIDELDLWFVTRWEHVSLVAASPEVFSEDMPDSLLSSVLGRNLMHAQGQYHRRLRSLVKTPFQHRELRSLGKRIISPLIEQLLNGMVRTGTGELIGDFAEPLSVLSLHHLVGFPAGTEQDFMVWFGQLAAAASNFHRDPEVSCQGRVASAAIDRVIDSAGADPGDETLLGQLLSAARRGALTMDEVRANVKLVVLGGMQEPRDLLGLLLFALLTHPAELARVSADRSLIGSAIEETLRWQSPVGSLTRRTSRATSLAGQMLPKGATVAAVIASANRDERRWPEPDRFDIRRGQSFHLAFGAGPHTCVGAGLARLQASLALPALLDSLNNLRLDDPGAVEIRGWEFRGPRALRVSWDAR